MDDELCPAGRAVAQPISALFHGDTVFLHDLDDVCLSFSRRVIAALLCVCVQTAYVRFKVQYEESRTQCGHYNLLLSSTRITLCGCAVNNQK